VDGKLSVFLQPAGRANGLYFDANSNLIACAEAKNELWLISPDLKITPLITEFQGRSFNGPNDLWIAPDGAIYFTDPFYLRLWTDRKAPRIRGEKVWRLSPDHLNLQAVASDLKKPNGITGTPDGRQLYVADIRDNKTWRYDILPDGSLTNKTLFCRKGSDGMTIDAEGNLYLCATGTTNGVSIFNPAGQLIDHINVPERWTANVCIGGADHQTLFITASESLYAIRLRVKGANAAK
jgi:gluconolactonase